MHPSRALNIPAGLFFLGLVLLGVGCATPPPDPEPEKPSPSVALVIEQGPSSIGAEPRTEKVVCLVIHHTAGSLATSLKVLQGNIPGHKVGVHYVLTDEPQPRVIRMVPETMSAYHAGGSIWGPLQNLNQTSIGIEIINLDGNIHPYTPAQVELLIPLCADILRRHDIPPRNVVAHSDIAIGRKIDPGALFPWSRLAAAGIGAWPLAEDIATLAKGPVDLSPEHVRRRLRAYGYGVGEGEAALRSAVMAFQRHFRPARLDGVADEETVILLEALLLRHRPDPALPAMVKP